jgi:hypothetical protein
MSTRLAENRHHRAELLCEHPGVVDHFETCYRRIEARDARYDGVFFSAVTSRVSIAGQAVPHGCQSGKTFAFTQQRPKQRAPAFDV